MKWAVVLYNDDVNSFEGVIAQIMAAIPVVDRIRAENFALRVDAQVNKEKRRDEMRIEKRIEKRKTYSRFRETV